jgi:polysaccharide pyruvyl transferase CsaB
MERMGMNEATGPAAADGDAHWRILVICRPDPDADPATDPVARHVAALRTLGHHVLAVDAVRHGLLDPASPAAAGAPTPGADPATVRIQLGRCAGMVEAFDPHLVIAAGRPMGFDDADARTLRAAGRVLVGVVLADPAVPDSAHPGPATDTGAPGRGFLDTHDLVVRPDGARAPDDVWRAVLPRLRSGEAGALPGLGAGRREEIRRVLSASLPPAKKVIVSGYYGVGNLGDELILASITQALRRADPAVQVTVAADRPLNVERSHGLPSYSRPDHEASLHEVRTAAAVVLGGGGLWHDYSFADVGGLMGFFTGARRSIPGYGALPLMTRMLGRGFHVVGMGVGPLTTPDARSAVRFLAEQAESIYVRERASAELLASLPVPAERIVTGPDVVYGVDLPAAADRSLLPPAVRRALEEGHTLVGLNLRTWAEGDIDALVRRTATALSEVAGQHRIAVVSVPMQWGKDRDQTVIRRVLDLLPSTVPTLGFGHRPSLGELQALYAELGALISMRLHSALLAHRCGVPVVGFGYDPKVDRHFEEVGRSAFCLPLEASPERIREVLGTALDEGLPAEAGEAVRDLERSARRALAVAAERIAATPAPDVPHTPFVRQAPSPGNAAPVKTAPGTSGPKRPAAARRVGAPRTGAQRARPAARFAFTGMQLGRTGFGPEPAPGRGPGADRLAASPDRLRLSLATDRPRRGMAVAWSGRLGLTDARDGGAYEVELIVDNHWSNAKAPGRVFVELEAGDARWREDLSLRRGAVRLRLVVPGGGPVAVTFRLLVARRAFRSASWTSATDTSVSIGRVAPVPDATNPGTALPQLWAPTGQVMPGA